MVTATPYHATLHPTPPSTHHTTAHSTHHTTPPHTSTWFQARKSRCWDFGQDLTLHSSAHNEDAAKAAGRELALALGLRPGVLPVSQVQFLSKSFPWSRGRLALGTGEYSEVISSCTAQTSSSRTWKFVRKANFSFHPRLPNKKNCVLFKSVELIYCKNFISFPKRHRNLKVLLGWFNHCIDLCLLPHFSWTSLGHLLRATNSHCLLESHHIA